MGSPHTKLTETICRGHNAVYELVHLTKPPEPGFNTIIFGLNLRRSGFHYHCDTIASLKAKNGKSRDGPVVHITISSRTNTVLLHTKKLLW